jgi:drug/metabolite transporter (DMT)-like permease
MSLAGPSLILAFCVSQAFRDVYFASVFQGVDFLAVVLLAFLVSALGFGAYSIATTPREYGILRRHPGAVVAMNVTTAMAWTSYFFALKHLEPSVVNTIHSGMGPLTVLALSAFGMKAAKGSPVGVVERGCYAGIVLALAALWWVVLSGRSGLAVHDLAANLAGLALLLVSGSSITVSLLYAKTLHDRGVGAETVSSIRYLLIVAASAAVVGFGDRPSGIETTGQLAILGVAASVLIVAPLYALQAGLARTPPLTGHVIRALGPVCVFAFEQLDGRIVYSTPTLVCILAYSVFVIAGNAARGWRGTPARGRSKVAPLPSVTPPPPLR